MTPVARLAVLSLACLQIVMWTCPVFCSRVTEPSGVAAIPETATGHEHHAHHESSLAVSVHTDAHTIDAASTDCCGSCGLEQIPQSLTEKYSAFANLAACAADAMPFTAVSPIRNSLAGALTHQPPGTSPPVTSISPLRI